MTVSVAELIERLSGLPQDWLVDGTAKGSLQAWEPGPDGVPARGSQYCYIFCEKDRPTRWYVKKRDFA